MTKTEIMLLAIHKAPLVALKDICDRYFGLCFQKAQEKAALNQLPVPTWRTMDSRKSPLMVRLSDLAEYIDTQGDAERDRWVKSQV